MNIDLKEMTQLAPIFRELFKGYHLSRSEPEPYAQLSNLQDQYRALFKALGFELVCDPRGFYYFVPEQMGAQVNKTAQRLALFTFILVEHLADQGRDPLAVLDGGSLGRDELPALLDKYRDLFQQAEVTTQDELEEKIIRRLTQLGFAEDSNGVYRFLSYLPLSSPSAMPVRYLAGDAGALEVLLSLALVTATAVASRRAAGRVFALAILMTGKEPSWREVWRWLRRA